MANTAGSSMIIKHYDGFGGNFIDSQYLGASMMVLENLTFFKTL